MRTEPVYCVNATQYEMDLGKHLTWDDESHCSVCRRTLDRFNTIREEVETEAEEYAMWNTGLCAKCNGTGVLGPETDAHPSVYGMQCPDCATEEA